MDVGQKYPDLYGHDHENFSVGLGRSQRGNGLLVVFMSTTCPFVEAQLGRIVALAERCRSLEIGFVAVYSNTRPIGPDDVRARTLGWHEDHGLTFDFLYDQSQEIADGLDAVCTPDFFLFDGEGRLYYWGRMDNSWRDPAAVTRRYLDEAVDGMLGGLTRVDCEAPSFGCTIKRDMADTEQSGLFIASEHVRVLDDIAGLKLVHALNGTLVEATPDIFEFLEAFREPTSLEHVAEQFVFQQDIEEEFGLLVDNGFINPVGVDQFADLKKRIRKREQLIRCGGLLSILRLNISTACNLRCTYCYMEKGSVNRSKRAHAKHMPIEIANKAIDMFFANSASNGRRFVTIRYIGGEPLANKRVLEAAMRLAEERGQELGIVVAHLLCTNGLLIDDAFADFLSGLASVHTLVSLDGPEEFNDMARVKPDGSGTYRAIVESIALLQAHGVPVSVPAVVMPANSGVLEKFLEQMAEMNVEQVGLNPEYQLGGGDGSAYLLQDLPERLLEARRVAQRLGIRLTGKAFLPEWHVQNGNIANCEAMGRAVVVDPDGTLSVCDKLDTVLGTVDNLDEFLSSPLYERFTMRVRGNIEACSECEAHWVCNGGCAAEVLASGGTTDDVATNCDFIRKMAAETMKLVFPTASHGSSIDAGA